MNLPLRLQGAESFRLVRDFLLSVGYSESSAADRLGISRLDELGYPELCDASKRERNMRLRDPLNAVLKLFLCGQSLDLREAQRHLPETVLSCMESLGLLTRQDDLIHSPVLMFPLHGLFLASDRYVNVDGSSVETSPDVLYLPLQRSASDFIAYLPVSRCNSFLDLGAGCGLAALWAAKRFAVHSWAVDITGRAVHFTDFNRRLNGLDNVTVLQGDLYEPVAGLTFDRIAMHPPYGLTESGYIYADGGDDGEQLVRRAIQNAPMHLSPGGIFLCWTTASDRREAVLEQRVRSLLAADSHASDVVVLVKEQIDPRTYAIASSAASADVQDWEHRFARLGVEQLVYGGILIRRHTFPGTARFTLRRKLSPETNRSALEWVLYWGAIEAQPDCGETLLSTRPKASLRTELVVRHKYKEMDDSGTGGMQPIEYTFHTRYPFETVMCCRSWLAYLVSRCNGLRSGADLWNEISSHLTNGIEQSHFLAGLSALISSGVIEIDAFSLPRAGSGIVLAAELRESESRISAR